VDQPAVNFGFSTCPNDTFAFHAIVHRLVPGPEVVPFMDDIEVLNARAERGDAEVTKVSIAAYGRLRDRYILLRAGGAAGFGVGPIVVARSERLPRCYCGCWGGSRPCRCGSIRSKMRSSAATWTAAC